MSALEHGPAPRAGHGAPWLIAKLVLALAIVVALVLRVGAADLIGQIGRVDLLAFTLATAIFGVQIVQLAARWRLIIAADGPPPPFWLLTRFTLMAHATSQVVPSSLGGDALRAYLMRLRGVNWSEAVRQVAIDRGIGLVGILVVAVLGLLAMGHTSITDSAWTLIGVVSAAVAIAAVVALAVLWSLRTRARHGGLWRLAESTWRALANLTKRPASVLAALIHSVAVQLWSVLAFWLIANGLDSRVTLGLVLAVIPLIALANVVPISIGGWGVREGLVVWAFSAAVSADEGAALAASLLYGATMALWGGVGAVLFVLGVEPDQKESAS